MKKIFLSFLLVMAGISHTLAQGLDGNVEQRLKDFFTRYETSYRQHRQVQVRPL